MGLSSLLADLRLPQEAYAALGGRNSTLVQFCEAFAIALVLLLLSLVWSYVTVRPPRKSRHTTTSWLLSGIGLAWLGWLIYGVFYFALHPRNYSQGMGALLLSSAAPPLWGLLNIVAVVSGAVLAGVLARKFNPRNSRRYGSNSAAVMNPPGSATTAA